MNSKGGKWELIVIGILVLIFLPSVLNIGKVVRKITGFFSGIGEDKDHMTEEKHNLIIDGVESKINKSNLSEPESWFKAAFFDLFNAMDGVGTDAKLIDEVFRHIRTKDDALMIYKEWGARYINGAPMDLLQALDVELNHLWGGDIFPWLNTVGNGDLKTQIKMLYDQTHLKVPW